MATTSNYLPPIAGYSQGNGWFMVTGAKDEIPVHEMRAAYDAVQDPAGWKRPIAEQRVRGDRLMATVAGIAYYAGSESYIKPVDDGFFLVKAPGYYLRVGA